MPVKRGRPRTRVVEIEPVAPTIEPAEQLGVVLVALNTTGITKRAVGDNAEEAITNLGFDWNDIKGKGIMTLTKDGKSLEKLFNCKQLRTIFGNRLTRKLWASRLEKLLSFK